MNKVTLSTSEKEVPKHKNALEEKYKSEPQKEPLNPDNIQDQKPQLPEPSGWRLLVLPFTPKEKTRGGILIAQESLDKLRVATNCGYVLKMGPLAYEDKEKYSGLTLAAIGSALACGKGLKGKIILSLLVFL